MRIFDPHIHMTSRTTDDYERMHAAGVRAVVEPAFWQGQPRTNVGSFLDYFDSLLGWEPYRAAQYGIQHRCALALNPKEAGDLRCAGVLAELPRYLLKDAVVAVMES
jgi:predicted metal-dependent TIM-barrel fold hydrolase